MPESNSSNNANSNSRNGEQSAGPRHRVRHNRPRTRVHAAPGHSPVDRSPTHVARHASGFDPMLSLETNPHKRSHLAELHRQAELEDDAIQRAKETGIGQGFALQRKGLSVSSPDDPAEREADRVADDVMRVPGQEEEIQGKFIECPHNIFRKCAACEEKQREVSVHHKADDSMQADAGVSQRIEEKRDKGEAIPENDRSFFEPRFGADLSGVRIHRDAASAELARAVDAQAFTIGSDVFFGAGKYSDSGDGRRLFAHELTHVQQQGGIGRIARKPGDLIRRERESDTTYEHWTGPAGTGFYDSMQRLRYNAEARRIADDIFIQYLNGSLSEEEARSNAVSRRNQLLLETRSRLSPGAARLSSLFKENPTPVREIEAKYLARAILADSRIQQACNINDLSEINPRSEMFHPGKFRQAVNMAGQDLTESVIQSSGRTNKVFTGVAKFSRVASPLALGTSLGVSGYEIYSAPESQRLYATGRETSGLLGGAFLGYIGGVAGAYGASLLCGPGAPACALVVTVVIGGAAAYGGAEGGKWFYEILVDEIQNTWDDIVRFDSFELWDRMFMVNTGVGPAY